MGGGGGGGSYYANLEKLYGTQAAQAERLMGLSEKLTYPMYDRMVNESLDYGSQANQNRMADQATADAASSYDRAKTGMSDELKSYGIQPGSPEYNSQMRKMATSSFGQGAAATTAARERGSQMGFARLQDTTNTLAGLPSNASSAMSSASATGSNLMSAAQRDQQMASANTAGAVRGGIDLYGFATKADGGPVLKLKGGGYVQKLAAGGRAGIEGALQGIQAAPPPPPSGPVGPSANAQFASTVGPGLMRYGDKVGQGIGGQIDKAAAPATPTAQATEAVDSVLGANTGAATTNAAAGAETAGAAELTAAQANAMIAAESGAAAGGAAGGAAAGTAAATLGAALPYVGAAMLAGSALGLFAEGGIVNQSGYGKGGEVDGPGGPKDDLIATEIPEGAFVMPIGAVKKLGLKALHKMNEVEDHSAPTKKRGMVRVRVSDDEFIIQPDAVDKIGLAKLEKIRQDGLAYEKKLGIGKA